MELWVGGSIFPAGVQGSGPWRMIKTTFPSLALACSPPPPSPDSLNGGSCPGVEWNGWEAFPSIGNGEAAVPSSPSGDRWGLGLPDCPSPSWGGSDQRECIWERAHTHTPPSSGCSCSGDRAGAGGTPTSTTRAGGSEVGPGCEGATKVTTNVLPRGTGGSPGEWKAGLKDEGQRLKAVVSL